MKKICVVLVSLFLLPILGPPTSTGTTGWSASIVPDAPIPAGAQGSWTMVIRVGESGFVPGATLRIAWRHNSDWSRPQISDPSGTDYARVYSPRGTRLKLEYFNHFKRPKWDTWDWGLELTALRGRVLPGAEIRVVLGDTSRGSPGTWAQMYEQQDFSLLLSLDASGNGLFLPLPPQFNVPIIAGPPDHLVLLGPGLVRPGEEFAVHLFAEDYAGNPAPAALDNLTFSRQHGDETAALTPLGRRRISPAVHELRFIAPDGEGPLALTVTDTETGRSALLENTRIAQHTAGIFWGDLHIHTELSDGTGTLTQNLDYAKSSARLDFCALTDHDFLLTDEEWQQTLDVAGHESEDGKFVVFAGYEFSAESKEGGDRNVLYRTDGPLIRCAKGEGTTAATARELYLALPADDVLVIPHVGGRRANWEFHDPHRERLAEISSVHGTFDAFYLEALSRGYTVGVVGSGDGHVGHPGRSSPVLTWARKRNGLVAVFAPALTRDDLWQALMSRRVYGTTGARILLDLTVADQPMGSILPYRPSARVTGWVQGTADITAVVLWSGQEPMASIEPNGLSADFDWHIDVPADGAALYIEVKQADGERAWSSPVWIRP